MWCVVLFCFVLFCVCCEMCVLSQNAPVCAVKTTVSCVTHTGASGSLSLASVVWSLFVCIHGVQTCNRPLLLERQVLLQSPILASDPHSSTAATNSFESPSSQSGDSDWEKKKDTRNLQADCRATLTASLQVSSIRPSLTKSKFTLVGRNTK